MVAFYRTRGGTFRAAYIGRSSYTSARAKITIDAPLLVWRPQRIIAMNNKLFQEQLSQLVSINSVSSSNPQIDQSNRPVVELLANWLNDLGFTCELQDVPHWPGKTNLIATLGTGSEGLVLAGHTDTVPCDPELWQQDPFQLCDRDHRFYGLGATDMKGFFPVILAALASLHTQPLKQPLIVLATADEESSMCGARWLAQQSDIKAKYAVIGEPTNLSPIRMHKGIMFESIRLEGKSGHSSNPSLGINAMESMMAVLQELMGIRGELQSRYHNPGFDIPLPTLNLGCIHGGDNPNRICGQCEVQFDLRLLPGMEIDAIRQLLQSRLRPIAEQHKTEIVFQALFPGISPYEQDANSTLVQTAERLTQQSAKSVAFATEAPFLKSMGMETIVMGPGNIDQAHQPGEFLSHDQINPAVNIIEKLIAQFCL